MRGIFQKENANKARKYGIYRHLPTYEKIIRNLVSFSYEKKNIALNRKNTQYLCLKKINVGRVRGRDKFFDDLKRCICKRTRTKEYLLNVSCYCGGNSKVIPVVSEFWVDQYNDFVENYCQTYIKYLIKG